MAEVTSLLLKRCTDVLFSSLMLLLTSPIMAVVALGVWLESGSPVIFRQERVGVGLRRFHILKFRTMRARCGGPQLTVGGDSRITRVGSVLRLTKIDELPQFWNVLRGDMSVVGPRPEVPEFVEMFKARFENILSIRPGITDLGSIYFRNEEKILAHSPDPMSEYRKRILPMKLDLAEKYLRERSLPRDIAIILKTAVATLWPTAPGQRKQVG